MGNDVKQDINVGVEVSGTSEIDQLNAKFTDFSNTLNSVTQQINNLGNLDLASANKSIDTITQSLTKLIDNLFSLYEKEFINDDQLLAFKETIDQNTNELNQFKTAIDSASESSEKFNKILEAISYGGGLEGLKEKGILSDTFGEVRGEIEKTQVDYDKLLESVHGSGINKLVDEQGNVIEQWNYFDGVIEKVKDNLEDLNNNNDDELIPIPDTDEIKNTDVNFKNLESTLLQLVKSGKLSTGSIESLAGALGATAPEIAVVVAAFAVLSKIFSEMSEAVDEVLDTFKEAGKSTLSFVGDLSIGTLTTFADGLEVVSDTFKELTTYCNEAIDAIRTFSDLGGEMQDSFFKIYQYLGADAGADIIKYATNLSNLYNIDNSKFLKGMRGVLAVTSQLGLDADGVNKYSKALTNLALDLSAFSGESVESIATQYENAINLGVLNSRSSIAKAFDLTDSDIEQFKKLNTQLERTNFLLQRGEAIQGTYSNYMNTAIGKVNQLKNAYQNFLNTVGQLALQLFSIVAPVLTKLINLATYAVNVLAKLLHLDLGTSSNGLASAISNNAVDNAGKYADNIGKVGDAIQDTGKKAKEASRKIASFDDVIQINEDKSSDNSKTDDLIDSLEDLQDYDPSTWLNNFEDSVDDINYNLPDLKKMIQDFLNDFKAWEEAIDWNSIREKARGLGKDLASLLNIAIDDTQAWKDFGNLIGNSVNTALESLNGFGKELHWQSLGTSLAASWNEFWSSLDEDLVADTVYTYFRGALEAAIAFLAENPLGTAGDSISEILVNIINEMSNGPGLRRIKDFIDLLIDNIFGDEGFINKALDNFEANNTGEKIAEIFGAIAERIGSNLPTIIETLSGLLVFELNTLGDSITSIIDNFFNGLDSDPEAIDKIINSIINVVSAVFTNLGKIGEALQSHKDDIIKLIEGLIDSILENSEEWGNSIKPFVDTLVEILENIDWKKIDGAIMNIIKNSHIYDLVKQWLSIKFNLWIIKVKAHILGLGPTLLTTISTLLNFLLNPFASVATLLIEKLDLINKLKSWLSEDVKPWLDEVLSHVGQFFTKIFNKFKEAGAAIKSWWSDKSSKWKEGWDRFWEGIHNGVEKIIDKIKTLVGGLIEKLTSVVDGIKNLWNTTLGGKDITFPEMLGGGTFKIPELATGGIVTGSTLANIGEDGAEAILPLQKNTEWMDALASKIAGVINSGGNTTSSPVNITLSNKNFYTRAEMLDFAEQVVKALRVYGVNVSVAY